MTQEEKTTKIFIDEAGQAQVVKELLSKAGEQDQTRIEKGVRQAACFWRAEDGTAEEFCEFCLNHYVVSPEKLDLLCQRLSANFETIGGHFNKMIQDLKRPLDLDMGEILPIDMMFGELDPGAHMVSDLFKSKIAFAVLLNFPYYTLAEKKVLAEKWSRKEWAYARVGDLYASRVPAEVYQKVAQALTGSEAYIADYNIYMGHLIDRQNNTYFPAQLKLISHWGLRDELKAHYGKAEEIVQQRVIYEVMKRIIRQEIPGHVINSSEYSWNPYDNTIWQNGKQVVATPEPNTRYQKFLNNFYALKEMDAYFPVLPSYILRRFSMDRELSEAEVERLFSDFISSQVVKETAKFISKRLNRKLEPFDIWYDGFKSRSAISGETLDKIVAEKYPTIESFEKDIAPILVKLGFAPQKAAFIASRITVDPARGAGHAWGAEMRSEKAHLRTRVPKNGMNYKGFNIAMHELGHNVEQVFTLYDVDYYMLKGVPNTAFTEAFAFVFQKRDLEVLGIKEDNPDKKHLMALDTLWAAYEIMGVSLVDMQTWNWLYAHPTASAEELKNAVVQIAIQIWNKYFAENFGLYDQPILAVYSHMIAYPLYLPDYPLGHVIEFQIEKFIEGKNLGTEMERMCVCGRIIPQLWMQNAVGSPISTKPLLQCAEEALQQVK
jgi:hypothetical protein